MRFGAQIAKSAPSLLVNGYALVANVGMTSVLGLAFWMIATRLYSQEQVGLAAALISLMTTISVLTQLNLTTFLNRYLPKVRAGTSPRRLIMKAYSVAACATAVVALVIGFGVGSVAEPLEVLRDHKSAMVLFVVSSVIWSVFALQEAALSGLRLSVLVPIRNSAYAIIKIVLMVLFAFVALPPPGGVYLAWVLPLIPIIFFVNGVTSRRFPAELTSETVDSEFEPRNLIRFLGWDYLGTFATTSAIGLATLLVTAGAGVESTATYHLAWTLSYSVFLVANSMSVSLVAEGASNPERLGQLIADTLCHTLLLVLAAVAVMAAAASQIMALFGQAYAVEGGAVLRVLAFSCIPWSATTVFIGAKRALGNTQSVAIVQIVTFLIFACVSAALLDPMGSVGVAYGWLAAHSFVCVGIIAFGIMTRGHQALEDWGLALASSMARMISGAKRLKAPESTDPVQNDHRRAQGASKQKGHKSVAFLQELANDPRLDAYRHLLPLEQPVGSSTLSPTPDQPTTCDRISKDTETCATALKLGISTFAELHTLTAAVKKLDDAWCQEWIEAPINGIIQSVAASGKNVTTTAAFKSLSDELRRILIGRDISLGLGHGNLWPGNLLFSRPPDNPHGLELSSVIDWDRVRSNAPKAIDLCHMTVTFRMLATGEEFGPILRLLLSGEGWAPEIVELFQENGPDGDIGNRAEQDLRWAFLVLTWLHHVAGNLSSSSRYTNNRLWKKVNVDNVLKTALNTASSSRP
ncbi:hypothetical protein [Shimia sp.]|uniref:hypothetical protein n=1 Tax=Shimia sp. TaxID=1954381 RepID=UPI0032994E56